MKRMSILAGLLLLSLAAAIPAAASAGESRTADFTLSSATLGEDVAISVYLPAGYTETQQRYPCLYILEDDLYHRALTGLLDTRVRLGAVPGMIVVGVAVSDRWRDLTPTRAGVPGGETIPVSGGAGRHREFFRTELIPRIESEFRTEPFRALCAHSLGGLYAITALLEDDSPFGAGLVTSPSLWWDDEVTAKLAAGRLPANPERRMRLFLATGGEDGTIQDPVDRFCAVLDEKAPAGLVWARTSCPAASHQEVPIRTFCDALDFLFADWALPGSAMEAGIEAVDAHFAMLSERYGYRIEVPEPVLNRLGYRLMGAGDPDSAVELFRRNAAAYPNSANVHDSLGEAYRVQGRNELARASYERALALDPGSSSARRALEELGPLTVPGAAACAAEIEAVHKFFQGWYCGDLERSESNFARLADALADDFTLITSGGQTIDRALLLQVMEPEWGTRPDMKMWTENFRFECAPGDTRLVTYEEHGVSGEREKATLISAVLRVSARAPGGLEWVHLHETEMVN